MNVIDIQPRLAAARRRRRRDRFVDAIPPGASQLYAAQLRLWAAPMVFGLLYLDELNRYTSALLSYGRPEHGRHRRTIR